MDQRLVEVQHQGELGSIVALRRQVANILKRRVDWTDRRLFVNLTLSFILVRVICRSFDCDKHRFFLLQRFACIKKRHQVGLALENVVMGSTSFAQFIQLVDAVLLERGEEDAGGCWLRRPHTLLNLPKIW